MPRLCFHPHDHRGHRADGDQRDVVSSDSCCFCGSAADGIERHPDPDASRRRRRAEPHPASGVATVGPSEERRRYDDRRARSLTESKVGIVGPVVPRRSALGLSPIGRRLGGAKTPIRYVEHSRCQSDSRRASCGGPRDCAVTATTPRAAPMMPGPDGGALPGDVATSRGSPASGRAGWRNGSA
jgi:hypothetical protein